MKGLDQIPRHSIADKKYYAACYKIINDATGNFYIGATTNPHIRILQHMSELKGGHHSCKKMLAEFKKHGMENFRVELLKAFYYDLGKTKEARRKIRIIESELISELLPTFNKKVTQIRSMRFAITPMLEKALAS